MSARTEHKLFTKAEAEALLCAAARLSLIGRIYFGNIERQEITWHADGSVTVLTHHTPAEPSLLPPTVGS